MENQYVGHDGVPLRHDGTPFPADPGQWTEEEKQYLTTYYFGAQAHEDDHAETVAVADVPEIHAGDGSHYA